MITTAIDDLGHPGAAQGTQGGVHRYAACPAGELRRPVEPPRSAGVVVGDVGRRGRHRRALCARVRDGGDPAVVRDVEPLVPVRGPRVGAHVAVEERPPDRAGRDPEAEGAVDVTPGAVRAAAGDDLRDRVKGAGVDVARLGAHDRRHLLLRQRALERGRTHPALLVGGHRLHPLLAETEHATGDADGHVRLVGGDHPHRRSAVKAIRLDIPARVPEHGVASGREAGEVRHLTAGDEPDPVLRRQAEDLTDPAAGHLLGHRERRCRRVAAGVLVPGREEPIGGNGNRQCPADHEAEIPWSG